MKIYTKTGDGGTTSLIGGRRVSKSDPRVDAYGTIDELMAHIAYLNDCMSGNENLSDYCADLANIQQVLMAVSSIFAADESVLDRVPKVSSESTAFLETRIDALSATLPPIDKFTIPGGHPLVSLAHIARTVCRRAERCATKVECSAPSHVEAMHYLNRLSDYLYTLGRKFTQEFNVTEILWLAK